MGWHWHSDMKRIVLGVLLFALSAGLYLQLTSEPTNTEPATHLPWQVDVAGNKLSVFGLTLGESTLADAMGEFQQPGEARLFVADDGGHSLEAYFDNIRLNGIMARFVVRLSTDQANVDQVIASHTRKPGPSGFFYKVNSVTSTWLTNARVETITYEPRYLKLGEEMIVSRFGVAENKELLEEETIWHYPAKGVRITVTKKTSLIEYQLSR